MSPLSVLFALLVCGSGNDVEVTLLGGIGISEYSLSSQLPGELDFGQSASAGCLELRAGYRVLDGLLLGIGMGLVPGGFEWRAESDSSYRTETVEEGHVELFGDWRLEIGLLDPFARAGIGLGWGALHRHYEHGEYVYDDGDGMATVPCVSLGGGFRASVLDCAFLQIEADYRFVFRDEFGGWQVTRTEAMNGWRLLGGVGARL